ncbi:putative ubiquinone biosynthesis protein [Emiliania huxleyi CCMP1516]|uniref:ABC1 atypical kinase-like domain-containing protein n=2 Tax=Emiliania huxleyi TaxID=2903 RepID=A0A0D3KIB6_EMIH1|nr:putative ubiquinone biosynthesis protein [Emiliania huxleyi CCMP1516]EOD35501.1 putative ubiquinone biosynthesis protein [Emiliania huxleyi CCMP1516]|eukprot:XP_005787930.1 putative ubiquinone biosynthesis protein [Emiliania huxleyi CCMP1516]
MSSPGASSWGGRTGRFAALLLLHGGTPAFAVQRRVAARQAAIVPEAESASLSLDGELHSRVEPHALELSRAAISASFGATAPAEELLGSLSAAPLGSGCIAQVLHPHVERQVADDLYLLRGACGAFELLLSPLLPGLRWLALPQMVDEFAAFMRSQLDLRLEARNLDAFRANFAVDPRVEVPRPLREEGLVARRVLVETLLPGQTLSSLLEEDAAAAEGEAAALLAADEAAAEAMQAAGMGAASSADASAAVRAAAELEARGAAREARRSELARLGLRTFLTMVLRHNFVHADLHPGNILVLPAGGEGGGGGAGEVRLGIIDAGLVVELTERDRRNFLSLFKAIGQGDGELAGDLMLRHAREQRCDDPAAFRRGMRNLVESARAGERGAFNLRHLKVGEVLLEVTSLVRTHHVQPDPVFTTLVCAIVVLEGLGRQLDPTLDLFSVGLPLLVGA